MQTGFKAGDRVKAKGEIAGLFKDETGTIIDVVVSRDDNSDYNVYRVAFNEKHVRMIGLYLRPSSEDTPILQVS